MPISVDHSKPVRTVDTSGKLISTNTNNAAPMKTVDTVGRIMTNTTAQLKAESQSLAEKAAASLPNFANGETSVPDTQEKPASTETKEEKVTEAQIRKEYLEAQRIKRQAQEYEKKAKSGLERAEAFEKARALAENGEDPTAILTAAGLDPVKFYRNLTDYALSDKGKQVEVDPVKKELNEHKKQLEEYKQRLDAQAKATQEREEMAAHNQVIQDAVIPLLQNNAERYETLVNHYGNQAAVEVYKNVWEIYQQTGVARKFEEVADEMEKYWTEQIESGINFASKMNKFKNRFAAQDDSYALSNTKPEPKVTPPSSMTLSNKQQVTTPPNGNPYRGLTKEERVAAILKKFDS